MKLKGKKIEKKTKPLIKKGGTTITYFLPEINIYPNNRFGDIARTQGLQKARNWRKVKEGTTAGMNKFGNIINSGLQLASSFIPVVSDIQDVKDLYTSVKNKDYIGTILSGLGFVPILGGVASNTNKLRKISEFSRKDWDKLTDREWDILYENAVKEKRWKDALRIRKEHFRVKTPDNKIIDDNGNPLEIYHGTDYVWNKFDMNKFGMGSGDEGWYGRGFYGTTDPGYARNYGSNINQYFTYSKNPYMTIEEDDLPGIFFNRPQSKLTLEEFSKKYNIPIEEVNKKYKKLSNSDSVFADYKSDEKFDELVIPTSNQIKSSNITEDDYGNLIPLSKRDDFANPDVRYSIIPLTLFGTSLYNRKKNEQKKSSKN